MSTQAEIDMQARLADMERQIAELAAKVNPAWVSGIDQLARTGKLQFGGPFGGGTVRIGPDGLEIVSATSPLDATQKDRYLRWFDKLNGTAIAKLGAYYSSGLAATDARLLVEHFADGQIILGVVDNVDSATPTDRVYIAVLDFIDAGSDSGFVVASRSSGSATVRNILQAIPHGSVTPGRVKVGYDAASTDDIISLVLDNADDTNDLPTASSTLRGGLALVEGSPDKVYVCRSTDGGSTFEWTQLGGGGLKTASGGYYLIPAGPSIGTSATSSAGAYGSWVEMRAASGNALYIVGVSIQPNADAGLDYIQIDIGTGAAASETSVGEERTIVRKRAGTAGESWGNYHMEFMYPIPVAASTRIACRVADDVGSLSHAITLHVIDQADVVSI